MKLSEEELRVIKALREMDDVQYTVCIASFIEAGVKSVLQSRKIEASGADNVVRLGWTYKDS